MIGNYPENCIRLVCGNYLNLLNPDPDLLTIENIGHGLSNQCRFANQSNVFYSVADHSIGMANYFVGKRQYNLAMEALLHDASEAFLGDVSTPLKSLLPEYRKIEKHFERILRQKYDLKPRMSHEVKELDQKFLQQEMIMFLPSIGNHNILPTPSSPPDSRKRFMQTYHQIQMQIGINNV